MDGADDGPGFLLWRVTLAWQRAMRQALGPHDLTHVQFVSLAPSWWLDQTDSPPQQQLAEHAGTDPMTGPARSLLLTRRLPLAGHETTDISIDGNTDLAHHWLDNTAHASN